MSAAGAGEPQIAELQALQEKREAVQCKLAKSCDDLQLQSMGGIVWCNVCREGVIYQRLYGVFDDGLEATADEWDRALSAGLGAKFIVSWYHNMYSASVVRMLRLGESIFEVMRSNGLNPKWDSAAWGSFTITAVDEPGAKLALAMAMHPRLGADSPLYLVAPGPCAVVPTICNSPCGLQRLCASPSVATVWNYWSRLESPGFDTGPFADGTGPGAPHCRPGGRFQRGPKRRGPREVTRARGKVFGWLWNNCCEL